MLVGDMELAPVRSLDDFLLGSARFQIPNYKDLEKWGNRVVNNLLYYQTNYLMLALVVFLLVGFLSPVKFLCGCFAIGVAYGLFAYFTNCQRFAAQFKKDYPMVGVLLILVGGYIIVYFLGSVLVFLFGVLLPFGLTFVHASMRLRNMKNKLTNKIEMIGLKKTPMGIFLESLEGGQWYSDDEPKLFHTEKSKFGLYDIKQKVNQ